MGHEMHDEVKTVSTSDMSPPEIVWSKVGLVEKYIKSPLRRFFYTPIGLIYGLYLNRKYGGEAGFTVDRWLYGQRGNDYASHRRLVNKHKALKSSRIFIAGCGTGRDIGSWMKYQPSEVIGLDYFNYESAWRAAKAHYGRDYPGVRLGFVQGDLRDLSAFDSDSFDIIGSDAVFEHLTQPAEVCREWFRILKPGGILYATFGPLWFGWHGDHFSGWDNIQSGYNHISLSPEDYKAYLDQRPYETHSEDDGRTWIKNGMFSYLKPAGYLKVIADAGFERRHVGLLLEPKAVASLASQPALRAKLLKEHSIVDLLTYGMTVVFQKPDTDANG